VHRKKKRNIGRLVKKYWGLGIILAAAIAIAWLVVAGPRLPVRRALSPGRGPLTGYIASMPTIAGEYTRFQGKALRNAEVERQVELANQRVARQDYRSAVELLELVSSQVAVPAVFNNLGVLYAQLGDRARAINAFREALARDIDYQPVRFNLARLKDFTSQSADPVTREIEPNDSSMFANIIALDKPVEAEIAPSIDDMDYFRINTPPVPRDLLSLEVMNRSATLAPVLRVYDVDGRILPLGKEARQPGASLTQTAGPEPNTTLVLQISGFGHSAGAYVLTVRPRKAFDAYEPNDDIYSARSIAPGERIDANIMDSADTDYYSFAAARSGTVTVNIRNRSATLIPALSCFAPDKRSTGFGPDVRTPGASLRHTIQVQENQTYYIQVWSQANSAGAYSLTVE
jgi:tetratricopeptide (TPR) repeat protein